MKTHTKTISERYSPQKVNVPILQLEVAWINNNCRSSDSSTDIIILPRMIRRMVVFNYTKINKQLEKVLGDSTKTNLRKE